MNVVGEHRHATDFEIILTSDGSHERFDLLLRGWLSPDLLPVLRGEDYVVPEVETGMTGVFNDHISVSYRTLLSSGRHRSCALGPQCQALGLAARLSRMPAQGT